MHYKLIYILSLIILIKSNIATSQPLAAFSDYNKSFYVFDNKKIRLLEHQAVISYKTGNQCVGYISNGNHFKIYHNHISYDVASMVDKYTVTDNLTTYQIGRQLYVFENGKKKNLSRYVGFYHVGDSMVGFFDTEQHYLQVFYNGQIITIADGLLLENTNAFAVGNNMLAFVDDTHNFKVFYQNEIYNVLETDYILSPKIGRNIMAFVEPSTDFLYAFFNGELLELENFKPKKFQVGYEKIAYIDHLGAFKLFDNGETYIVSDFPPDKFTLKDNILVFQQQQQLWVFYKGNRFLIENYIPIKYKFKDNTLAYINLNGHLNIFENNQTKTLSYERINNFEVLKDIVIYNQGVNTTKIYFNGNTY